MPKKIKWSDLSDLESVLSDLKSWYKDDEWAYYIKGYKVSIVKWNINHYNGYYEIHSYNRLFTDVERYKTKSQVLARLNELAKGYYD